jgi:hypothetical protein
VDDVQQLRHPLDLVQDHGVTPRVAANEVEQPLGPGGQLTLKVRTQQIQVEGLGQGLVKPRGLARAARSEEEEALRGRLEEARC